ncbi:MAG: response regulator [Pseudomonadota bacterium]
MRAADDTEAPTMKVRTFSQTWTGAAVAALGLVVTLGWSVRSAALVQLHPAFIAMVLSTGLCFFLLGVALLCPTLRLGAGPPLRVAAGAAIVVLATLAILENLFDIALGIDLPALHAWLVDGNPKPGRMALNTGLGFLSAGLVLVLAGQVRSRASSLMVQIATFAVVLLGLTGLVGYTLELDLLYGLRATRMAVHTAAGMTLAGFGLWDSWRHAPWAAGTRYFREDEKVAFIGAALLIVVALGAGVAGFAAQQSTFEEVLSDSLNLAVRNHTTIFHVEVEHAIASAKSTAGRPNLNKLTRQLNEAPGDAAQKSALQVIGESVLASGVTGVAIVDARERELIRVGRFSARPPIAVDLGTSVASTLVWDGGFYLKMALPLYDANGPIGKIFLEQPMPLIADQFMNGQGLGDSGEIRMCFFETNSLHCFPDFHHPLPYSTARDNSDGRPLPMNLAAQGKSGLFKGLDYSAHQVVAAYGPLNTTGLGLVIKENAEELMQPIRDQFRWSIPLLLVLVTFGAKLLHSQITPLVANLLRTQRDATDKEARIRAVIDGVGEGIVTIDEDGVIESFNDAAAAMFGYRPEAAIGAHIGMLMPEALRDAHTAGMARYLAGGAPKVVGRKDVQMPGRRKDGTVFSMELAVSQISDGGRRLFVGIVRDISARERDLRALVTARDQLLTAADVAELGIWSWSLEDNGLEWNERMFDFYDVARAQRVAGLHFEQWRARVHPDDIDDAIAKLDAAVAGTGVYDPVFRVIGPDGQVRFIQAAATVERDKQGKALRVLGINRDISLQRQAEQTLLEAKTAADQANRAKSEFLANMSHEIRSPMNAVLGMLMLLKKTALDARQLDYASKAEAAGRALLGILNDILDFSRVEAGKLELDPQLFSIDKVLRELAVILSANVGEKNIEILYRIDPALPDLLVGDALRLQQVLINLAGNAIKFTASGEVVVSAALLGPSDTGPDAAPGAPLTLGFSIRDTGIGISPQQCRHIFEGFSQAEASTARRFGGSGLGLAISQRLVGLMGGTLGVESEVGKGSTFSFNIVCERGQGPAEARRHAPLAHMHCMVIDDNAMARDMLADMLGAFGWSIDAMESGAQALAAIEADATRAYDVIFVDWNMPGMDGWETSERIRRMAPTGKTPLIVMVTAHGREVLAQRHAALPSLLDGFLVKPVTSSMLFDAVSDALASVGAIDLGAAAAPAGAQRLNGMHLLVVEDNLTNQQVARELLSMEGALVEVADSGRAALVAIGATAVPFDCVLMDIQMPDMDGYQATRLVRKELGMRDLPIVAMTANAMASDREAALAAGMNDHVGKPFDLDMLVTVILKYGGRNMPDAQVGWPGDPAMNGGTGAQSGAQSGAADAAANAAATGAPVAGIDSAAALARFGGNAHIYATALRAFAGEASAILAALMARAPRPDANTAARHLHTLKGLAGTIGAGELAKLAGQLEQACRTDAWEALWDEAGAVLAADIDSVGRACAAMAATLAPARASRAAGPAAPADMALARARLANLKGMLEASSLDALPLFEEIMQAYGAALGAPLVELGRVIDAMDFAAAALQCDGLLQGMGAN